MTDKVYPKPVQDKAALALANKYLPAIPKLPKQEVKIFFATLNGETLVIELTDGRKMIYNTTHPVKTVEGDFIVFDEEPKPAQKKA
jgi:hypothetical protein